MIENITYNNSTNLLNKCSQQKTENTNIKISGPKKDEVVINENNNKKKGSKIIKTILGFGSSATIGGFVGKFLAEKKLPQFDKVLWDKEYKITENIDKIFYQEKGGYNKLEKIIDHIVWGIDKPECYIFESKNKENTDKLIKLINKIFGKPYEAINLETGKIPFDSILKTRKNPNEIKLFNLENAEKCLEKEFKEKYGNPLEDFLTNTKNKNIYFFHVDKIKPEYSNFTKKLYIDKLKDFDKYLNLLEEWANLSDQMRKIDKLKKLNLPAIGIAAGLAVATGVFAILKIKNKKNTENTNKNGN